VTRLRFGAAAIASLFLLAMFAATAQSAISIYENSEAATFLGKIRKGKCKVKGTGRNKRFHAGGKTTNGAYTLDITILDFKGFGKDYDIHYGDISTTVDVEGTRSADDFSNAFPFPGGQPPSSAGSIAFARGGDKVGAGAYGLANADYSRGVAVAGKMRCRYPS